MDNMININNTKANTLEFEMTIEGANTSDVDCHFVIVAKTVEFRFKAKIKDKKENLWTVNIPAMAYLERTTYKCYTEVITDGQYFKPMKGNVNVVGSAEIYTSTPKNKTVESDIKKKKVITKENVQREEKRKNVSWRQREKSIEQVATELMEKANGKTATIKKDLKKPVVAKTPTLPKKDVKLGLNEKKKTPKLDPSKTENKLHAILEETANKPSKIKPIITDDSYNVEMVKALIKEKEEAHRKVIETDEVSLEDPNTVKIRAILEESGIKPKVKKKKKVSFVRTRLLN